MKGKGDDNRQRTEWRITLNSIPLLAYAASGISSFQLIRFPTHCLFNKSNLMINFLPTNSEGSCQFALRHSNLSLSLTNNTHTIAPLKKTSLDSFSCVIVRLIAFNLSLVVLLMMLCFHIHTSFIYYLLSFCDARKFIFPSLRSFLFFCRLLGNEPIHIL